MLDRRLVGYVGVLSLENKLFSHISLVTPSVSYTLATTDGNFYNLETIRVNEHL